MDTAKTPRATVGIICEFNPFHNGHAYLLKKARELGDCVICVMSGRTVQRGTVAVADPYVRAKMALDGGADLVLELPFPWCSGSAAYFADASVGILTALGVDLLLFGSECGDLSCLQKAADISCTDAFVQRYTELCQAGNGTAAAWRTALCEQMGDHPLGANDFLGVAYLNAIAHQASPLCPHTVPRLGDGYHETELHKDRFPSATALRACIKPSYNRESTYSEWENAMPPACFATWQKAVEQGEAPADGRPLADVAHAAFRLFDRERLQDIAELSGGLGDRMIRTAHTTANGTDFFDALKTRLYPDARLCRGMLFGLTDTRSADLSAVPTYTTVLAANRVGCAYLSTIRKKDTPVAVVTKAADAPDGRQKELCERVDALFSLCLPTPRHTSWLVQKSPYIQKD